MKAILFEIYYEGKKDEIVIDRRYRPKIKFNDDNTCLIVGRNHTETNDKVFARIGVNHSVVCMGEVDIKDKKDTHSKT